MKRLIVLTVLATLLASLSGCSILGGGAAQSCDTCETTSPLRSKLSQISLPRISLPWRRDTGADCNTFNDGYVDGGFVAGGFVDGGQINGGYVSGGYVDGGIVSGSFSSSNHHYHPEVVGGTVSQSTSVSAPVASQRTQIGTIPRTDLDDFEK